MPSVSTVSPELTAGAGFTFENGVAAFYFVALLAETTAPGLGGRCTERVLLQQGPLGQPLDDLIVEARGADMQPYRLSLQVKREIVIGATASNKNFRDIILRAHETIAATSFTEGVDRVGAIVGTVADASLREFSTLCDWARFDACVDGFIQKLKTPGFAGDKLRYFDDVKKILADYVAADQLDIAVHRLLAHFVLMRHAMVGEASINESDAITRLADVLHSADRLRAADLWQALMGITRLGAGCAAALDRKTLIERLGGAFRLRGASTMLASLTVIADEAKRAAAEIGDDVAGFTIERHECIADIKKTLVNTRFVQISGLPGTGKSAVLKAMVSQELNLGPVLFLKSDRLMGNTWAQYATSIGINASDLEALLIEVGVTGAPILFIDGIDRVAQNCRGIICDLLNILHESDKLVDWRVVVTLRDNGIEPVRVWLPRALVKQGASVINIEAFNDQEAKILAAQVPSLAPLLFNENSVKNIVRRPFFASVMVRNAIINECIPTSEIQLASLWWEKGGYAAEAASAFRRQQVLVTLARKGAMSLGQRIGMLDLNPDALSELEADGIVRQVRRGQVARFVHDIYFEWAFLQLLVAHGDQWHEIIQGVGEPPALGRVVELLSQVEISEGETWQQQLEKLEQRGDIRSQWLRSWMVGPIGLPAFNNYEPAYNAAMLADGARRVAKLAVWIQAEKTRPNPAVLSGGVFGDLKLNERIRLADSLAWPSDARAWRRLCYWMLEHIDSISCEWWPDILAVFEVWQNAAANFDNPLSKQVVILCKEWVEDIDVKYHGSGWPKDYGKWEQLSHDSVREIEGRLREMVLRSARTYPEQVLDYFRHLRELDRMPREVFNETVSYGAILAEACEVQFVDFCLWAMKRPLPVDRRRRHRESINRWGDDNMDWEKLAVSDDGCFFPCAPTREPFVSLFKHASLEARRLVRELANHATRAWRQLHRIDKSKGLTPVPLQLEFPWGKQIFWGGTKQYLWSRGIGGPKAVVCGYMALEEWAFEEVKSGRSIDEVLRELITGHNSCAVLAIAVAIIMEWTHCSDVSLPILTCQRLWRWDIERFVKDMAPMANLMGFYRRDRHSAAVVSSNERLCRKKDIRGVASVFILRGGNLGSQASKAILHFSNELAVDYAETRYDADAVNELMRTAEIWAEVGRRETYRASIGDDGRSILISHNNEKAKGPDIEAMNLREAIQAEQLGPLLWAQECLDKRRESSRMPLNDAIESARRLYAPGIFNEAHKLGDLRYQRQAAIAGVAAAALCVGEDISLEQFEWAAEVCLAAWLTPEAPGEFFIRESSLIFNPVLYAVKGLSGLLRRDAEKLEALVALVEAVAHPYDEIKAEAIIGMVVLWDCYPDIGWFGLHLACDLALIGRPDFRATAEERYVHEVQHIKKCIEAAFFRAQTADDAVEPLPSMPPAWMRIPDGYRAMSMRYGRDLLVQWEHYSTELNWTLMTKVLKAIPVATVLADEVRKEPFLFWCEELVRWTVDRLSPHWARESGETTLGNRSTELFEWRADLYQFLAQVSVHLDPQDTYRRFIAPAAVTDDETFGSLLASFVWIHTCKVMDEPMVPKNSLEIIQLIVPCMLQHKGWASTRRDDGSLYDHDLSRMVRSVFFVDVEKAMGAARFANANWQEVLLVVPLFEPIIIAAGSNRTVAEAYVTLCERAFGSLPLDTFIRHIPYVVRSRTGLPSGWRGTNLPARLADLIQRYSESVESMSPECARILLRALDCLVDMGDRRAAAVQCSEAFKEVRLA